jgi:hypothetical protein
MAPSPAVAAAAPTAPDSARITLEHFGIDMRVDEVLPLREQTLYPASGGVPFLPGVEEFVRAMNKVGVRMAVATSSLTRLLEAKSAGKEEFFAILRALCAGMMSSESRTGEASEGRRGSQRAFLLLGRVMPKAKI